MKPLTIALLSISSVPAAAQRTTLDVVDLAQGSQNSACRQLYDHYGTIYAASNLSGWGSEPVAFDLEGNYRRLADLWPGTGSSHPEQFTGLGHRVFFTADADAGREVYLVDERSNSVRLLADLAPGTADSRPMRLTRVGGYVWFTACSDGQTRSLYRVDPRGTLTHVEDLGPERSSDPEVYGPWHTPFGVVYLSRPAGTSAWTLKTRSDDDPPVVAGDFYGTAPSGFVRYGDGTLFAGMHGLAEGVELHYLWNHGYSLNLVADFRTAGSSNPSDITVLGESIFCMADDGTRGRELFYVSARRNGTVIPLPELAPGPQDAELVWIHSARGQLMAATSSRTGSRLWGIDLLTGTLHTIRDFSGPISTTPGRHLRLGDSQMAFVADDGDGAEPWLTDGTANGTYQLEDVMPGLAGSVVSSMILSRQHLVFVGREPQFGDEPRKAFAYGAVQRIADATHARGDLLIECNSARIGRRWTISGQRPTNFMMVLLAGSPSRPQWLPTGVHLALDVPSMINVATFDGSVSAWEFAVDVPYLPTLLGAGLGVQAVSVVPYGPYADRFKATAGLAVNVSR